MDSKTGKSTDNFVGSPEKIQHDKQALKKCKEWVTKHFNSVFDTSTVGNLPSKVFLVLKENATPYQALVHRVLQVLHEPLKIKLNKLVSLGVLPLCNPYFIYKQLIDISV